MLHIGFAAHDNGDNMLLGHYEAEAKKRYHRTTRSPALQHEYTEAHTHEMADCDIIVLALSYPTTEEKLCLMDAFPNFVPKRNGVAFIDGINRMQSVIEQLLSRDGTYELRRAQEQNFPLPETWNTTPRVIDLLELLWV